MVGISEILKVGNSLANLFELHSLLRNSSISTAVTALNLTELKDTRVKGSKLLLEVIGSRIKYLLCFFICRTLIPKYNISMNRSFEPEASP